MPYNVTVDETEDSVLVSGIEFDAEGNGYGKSYTFTRVNRDTVAMPSVRDVPDWVKDAIVEHTSVRSFYNGEANPQEGRKSPEPMTEGIDVVV